MNDELNRINPATFKYWDIDPELDKAFFKSLTEEDMRNVWKRHHEIHERNARK